MSPKPGYRAPFAPNGNLLHYVPKTYAHPARPGTSEIDWREIESFTATLRINTMYSGRSAKYTEWIDADGHCYPMFVVDLLDLLRQTDILHGTVTGTWIVRKRGGNYGIRYLPAAFAVAAA